jgi:lipoprotein-releasing system ATP-binding protein
MLCVTGNGKGNYQVIKKMSATMKSSENNAGNQPVLSCKELVKFYQETDQRIDVLRGINLDVQAGEYIAIVGRSGSGKTTLLHMLAGLEQPSSGSVRVCGKVLSELSDRERGKQRNRHIGFVYQFHHLLPEFSALENVMMPVLIAGKGEKVARQEAQLLLKKMELGSRLSHRPAKLSGGERQRVAIARALVNRPDCVLADEPTGNLDAQSAAVIHELILGLNRDFGLSFVLVTHDEALAAQFQKLYRMEDGKLKQEAV